MNSRTPTLERTIKHEIFLVLRENPLLMGEVLLQYAFVGEGRGCYSNFELRDSFKPYPEGAAKFADDLLGYGYATDEDEQEELARIKSFKDEKTGLVVVWFWEGDGHIIFDCGDFVIENSDIKCDYRWRFLLEP